MNRPLVALLALAALLGAAYGVLRFLNTDGEGVSPSEGAPPRPGGATISAGEAKEPTPPGAAPAASVAEGAAPAAAEPKPSGPPPGTIETAECGFLDPLFVASNADLRATVDTDAASLDAVVATVNGEKVLYRDLLDEFILLHGDQAVEQVLMEWLLVAEMGERGWRPTDEEIEKAFDDYLKQNRIKDAAAAVERTKFPESYLRFQAMLQTAFMKIIEQDQGGAGQVHPLFMQLWRDETMARRRVDRRAIDGFPAQLSFRPELVVDPTQNPGFLSKDEKRKRREEKKKRASAAASGTPAPESESGWQPSLSVHPVDVKDPSAFESFKRSPTPSVSGEIVKEDGERIVVAMPFGTVAFEAEEIGPSVRPLPPGVLGRIDGRDVKVEDVAPRVLPQITPGARKKVLDELVKSVAVKQALAKAGVKPDPARAREAFAKEEAEFAGSIISFEMYLQYDDSNPRLYFRDLLLDDGIHQLVGGEPADDVLRSHFLNNPVFFGHGAVRASHVLYSPIDEATGKEKGPTAWDDALTRAKKGADQLRQGLAFDQLVMKETDDKETRQYTEITREESEASGIVIQDPNDRRPKNVKARVAGDLSYFPVKKGRVADSISAVAFTLKEGEWAGPVKSPQGWHLIRVSDVRRPRRLSFDPPPPPDEAPRPGETPSPSPRQKTVFYDERLDEVRRDYLEDLRLEWTETVMGEARITVSAD